MRKIWKLGELFCGAGGFAEGAKQAGFEHVWAVDHHDESCITFGNNQNCEVFTQEIDEFVQKENLKKLKKIDGLLFGFPCNDFSLVGKNKKLKGKYGGLYKRACDALEYLKPNFFVAENVTSIGKTFKTEKEHRREAQKNHLASTNYKNFKQIMGDLANCTKYGYRIYADNYKFEEYGIPQTRHRMILVGFRDDFFTKNKINFERMEKSNEPAVTCKKALEKIPKWAKNQEETRHDERVIRRLQKTAEGKNVWDLGDHEDGLPGVTKARMSQIYKRLDSTKPAYTVTGSGGGGTHVYHFKEDRALTNRERARLQTFDDKYEFYGGKESVRRQIGMAVPVLAAKQIMLSVKKALKKNTEFKTFHHDWMIKAKGTELYFTGKESLNEQLNLDLE